MVFVPTQKLSGDSENIALIVAGLWPYLPHEQSLEKEQTLTVKKLADSFKNVNCNWPIRYIKNQTWLWGLSELHKRNLLFIAERQDYFFCFIPKPGL